MEYIHSTYELRLTGFIGDKAEKLELIQYVDADFASDKADGKSTSGLYLVLAGPSSFFPLAACSKKQTAISHSTPGAEIVAAEASLRTQGVAALDLWGCAGSKDQVIARGR